MNTAWIAMARRPDLGRHSQHGQHRRERAEAVERPALGKLVAYQAYSIQDHQTGMKSAANSAIPSIVGSSCRVCSDGADGDDEAEIEEELEPRGPALWFGHGAL